MKNGLKNNIAFLDVEFDEALMRLAAAFAEQGVTLYAVGGLIRNTLLDLPLSDIDITSAMNPEAVLDLCAKMGFQTVKKGIAFGMVEIRIEGNSYEHTTFRKDKYPEGGFHKPIEVRYSSTPYEDAFRRDFSANAVYCDILTKELVDPTGGIADIEKRVIRATSPDPSVILRDDGLRILRLCRFAAELGFGVEPGTLSAARKCAGLLRDISAERIRGELVKILMADVKYGLPPEESVFRGLKLLDETGAIDVILPELAYCRGVVQNAKYHRFDVMNHSFHSVEFAEPILTLRIACLLHDVAKPVMLEKNGSMHGHEAEGAIIAREIMRRLKFDNDTAELVEWLVLHHMFDLNGNAKDSTLKKRFCRWGIEKTELLIRIREADFYGSHAVRGFVKSAERWKKLLLQMREANTPFMESALDCTGEDIMKWLNIPPSPAVGNIKSALLLHCAVHPGDNKREKLMRLAKAIKR